MLNRMKLVLLVLLAFAWSAPALAQTTPASGIRATIIKQIDAEANKLISLAEAIPADKYSWRPAEGVRSIGEVVAHVAGANYFIPTFVGTEVPSGVNPRSFEEAGTDKNLSVQRLKASVEHMRSAISGMKDADLEKAVQMFGNETTYQGALLGAAGHVSEHLGQLIAYARMNDITPPWSQN